MSTTQAKSSERLTPMLKQYFSIKEEAGEAILFFRMGDFYELFDLDAKLAAPILEIVLTSRERGDKNRIPFCGVPHHSANTYILKLIKLGYRVAIADQLEDAKFSKGLVKRGIVRIYTPGCIDELESLQHDVKNNLAAVYEDPKTKSWAVLVMEYSTGEIRLGNLESLELAIEYLEKVSPVEILVRRFFLSQIKARAERSPKLSKVSFQSLSESSLNSPNLSLVSSIFGGDCTEWIRSKVKGGLALVGSILDCLTDLKQSTSHFTTVSPLDPPDTMLVSQSVLRDLEVFETFVTGNPKGSLYHSINRCLTPMGSRFLKQQLINPCVNEQRIVDRHLKVDLLYEDSNLLGAIRSKLKGLPDLERLTARLAKDKSSPLELARIRETLRQAMSLHQILKGPLKLKETPPKDAFDLLERSIESEPAELGFEFKTIRSGFDETYDELVEFAAKGNESIKEYEQQLRQSTGIQSLKIRTHKSLGLLIEVTKSNLGRVPDDFIRKQTMVNCERFITDKLGVLEQKINEATEQALKKEREIFGLIKQRLSLFIPNLLDNCRDLEELDLVQGFAKVSVERGFVKASICKEQALDLTGSRHPVVESFVGEHAFVANDIRMDSTNKQFLITGPNMAGKSTVMRQVAIAAFLNQIGCFVPARKASLPVFDQIFTRVGAADDLTRGYSTFMVEMIEAASILRYATPRSLVILDEVGRGTSTEDGVAIASAILEFLASHINCLSFFATHYHELVPIANRLPTVICKQIKVDKVKGKVVLSHKLVDGSAESSFGLEVAKLAGIPKKVVDRAKDLLDSREFQGAAKAKEETLFGVSEPSQRKNINRVELKLSKLSVDHTTPMQALGILKQLKNMIEPSTPGLFD